MNVSNEGTKVLELTPSVTGLPSGVTILSGLDSITLESGEYQDVTLVMEASYSAQQASSLFDVEFSSAWVTESLNLELQITERREISIDSTSNKIYASPIEDTNMSLILTNLGTTSDTFLVNIDNENASDWFSVNIDYLSLNLDSGESGTVVISVREVAIGAPSSGTEMIISVSSVQDSTISDEISIDIIPQYSDGLLTINSNDDSAKPGENITRTETHIQEN